LSSLHELRAFSSRREGLRNTLVNDVLAGGLLRLQLPPTVEAVTAGRIDLWFEAFATVAIDGIVSATEGHQKRTSEDIRCMWRLVDRVKAQGSPLSLSLAAAYEQTGVDVIESVLHLCPQGFSLHVEGPASHGPSFVDAFAHSMRVEYLLAVNTLRRMVSAAPPGRPAELLAIYRSPLWRVMLLEQDLASYRYWTRQLMPSPHVTGTDYHRHLNELEVSFGNNATGVATRRGFDGFFNTGRLAHAAEAARRLGLTAMAVASFRTREKRFPARLEELVPGELPTLFLDPFDCRPLRMVKTKSGIALYSVAFDGVDGGGRQMVESHSLSDSPGDMVIQLTAEAVPFDQIFDGENDE
jgi:hypothetical protein